MIKVKTFSVSKGDMFYIKDIKTLTIIDSNLVSAGDIAKNILNELHKEGTDSSYNRFISTHCDKDHITGIEKLNINNFYYVNNSIKLDDDASSKKYLELKDDKNKECKIYSGLNRAYLNQSSGGVEINAHIRFLWPDVNNIHFKEALNIANTTGKSNNICPIIEYTTPYFQKVLWFGDMEEKIMEKIKNDIMLPKADIVFAPHHGRDKLPLEWLERISPKIIVIGEAPSDELHYYPDKYNEITQNTLCDITFVFEENYIHVFSSNSTKKYKFLSQQNFCDLEINKLHHYLGSILSHK